MGPFTIRRALTSFADLTAKPRQSYLKEIAQYAEGFYIIIYIYILFYFFLNIYIYIYIIVLLLLRI